MNKKKIRKPISPTSNNNCKYKLCEVKFRLETSDALTPTPYPKRGLLNTACITSAHISLLPENNDLPNIDKLMWSRKLPIPVFLIPTYAATKNKFPNMII